MASLWWGLVLTSWLWGIMATQSAIALPLSCPIALLDYHQEAPGQVLYKSFHTVKDQHGHPWKAIAFNHSFADGRHNFQLRLVGFPGTAVIDRSRPLHIKTALGHTFTAPDIAPSLFQDSTTAEPNVAQYDFQPFVAQLPPWIPLRLTLPIMTGTIRLLVGPSVIMEWQAVATGDRAPIQRQMARPDP